MSGPSVVGYSDHGSLVRWVVRCGVCSVCLCVWRGVVFVNSPNDPGEEAVFESGGVELD